MRRSDTPAWDTERETPKFQWTRASDTGLRIRKTPVLLFLAERRTSTATALKTGIVYFLHDHARGGGAAIVATSFGPTDAHQKRFGTSCQRLAAYCRTPDHVLADRMQGIG